MPNDVCPPFRISYKSFSEDSFLEEENVLFIDRDVIVFNSDCVCSVEIVSIDKTFLKLTVHLKNGIAVIKTFNITDTSITLR